MTANTPNRDGKGKFAKAAFKVGDKVRAGSQPEIGTITEFLNCGRECRVQFDPPCNSCREVTQTLRKAEDAPSKPTAGHGCLCWSGGTGWTTPDVCPIHGWRPNPDPERLAECIQERAYHDKTTSAYLDEQMGKRQRDAQADALITHIKGKFHAALGMSGASWGDLANMAGNLERLANSSAKDLKTMTADRDSLMVRLTKAKRDAAATQSDWECAHELLDKAGIAMGSPALGVHLLKRICVLISHHDHERKGREAAEAKLADIAAINRVAEIVNALPEGSEDWHFQGLVAGVVKGGVAA